MWGFMVNLIGIDQKTSAMRTILFLLLSIALFFACDPHGWDTPPEEDIVFENVTLLPMTGAEATIPGQTVVIRQGRISEIGPSDAIRVREGAQVIDGTGKFLMPGLTEMHAHIPVAQEQNDSLVRETLFLYLSQGVTTIRGMLGNPYHLNLREWVAKDSILGPRIFTSSPSMNGNSIPTVTAAEEKVRQYKEDGYDFLKIHPGIKLEVMQKLVETAREVDIPFSGHVPADVGIRRAIDFGYGTIDHLDGYVTGMAPEGANADDGGFFGMLFTDQASEERMAELVQKTKAAGIAVVPTQTLFTRWISPKAPEEMLQESEMKYIPARMRYQWRMNKQQMLNNSTYSPDLQARFVNLRQVLLRELFEAGVPILLGSDAPQVFNVPGFSILHELEDMAEAGLPLRDILYSGTAGPAAFFGAEGNFGTLETGVSADLLLLEANPLQDISNIREQAGVMVRGQWLSQELINEGLAEIAARHQ